MSDSVPYITLDDSLYSSLWNGNTEGLLHSQLWPSQNHEGCSKAEHACPDQPVLRRIVYPTMFVNTHRQ